MRGRRLKLHPERPLDEQQLRFLSWLYDHPGDRDKPGRFWWLYRKLELRGLIEGPPYSVTPAGAEIVRTRRAVAIDGGLDT